MSEMNNEVTTAGLLNVLMYLDMEDVDRFKDENTVKRIIEDLAYYYGSDSCSPIFEQNYAGVFKDVKKEFEDRRRKYQILVNVLSENSKFGELVVNNHVSNMPENATSYKDEGLCACTFEDSEGNVYFVYRGTGSGEWIDNGIAISGTVEESAQQIEAAAYFDNIIQNYLDEDHNIIITGHSKGGNKAQFTTITAEYRDHIDVCYNFDGQGMSSEAIENFEELSDYDESCHKMYSFCCENDFVNVLGVRIVPEENRYYLETVYDINQEKKSDFQYYHYADAYFSFDGSMSGITDQGELSKLVEYLALEINDLPPNLRIRIANSIMSIFQKSNPTVGGEEVTIEDYYIALDFGLKALIAECLGEHELVQAYSDLFQFCENSKSEIIGLGEDLYDEIKEGVEAASEVIDDLYEGIVSGYEALEEGWNDFQEEASEVWEDFQDGALETWDGVCNFFNPYVEEANEFINDSVEVVSDGIENIKDDIEDGIDAIESGWNDFQDGAEDLWSDIQEGAGDAWNDFQEEASDTWDDVYTFFNPYVEEAKDFVDDSVESVSDGIDDLQEGASNAWDDLQENASNAWDSIWNQFNPEPEKVDDDIDEVKDSSNSGSSFLSNIDIAAVASSLQQSISDAWSTLQAKLEEVETVGIYPGMPYNSQYTNVGSFTSNRSGGSDSEVDLYMLTQLRNNLRNLEQSFERSIADILRESNRVIRDTDSDYREYYVQQEIQRIYSTHSKLQRKARSLGEKLERKREALNFALEHYQQVENDIIRSLAY